MDRILTGRDLPDGGRGFRNDDDDDDEGNQPFIEEDNNNEGGSRVGGAETTTAANTNKRSTTNRRGNESLRTRGVPPTFDSSSFPPLPASPLCARVLVPLSVLVSVVVMVALVAQTGVFTAMAVDFRGGILVSPYSSEAISLMVDSIYYDRAVTQLVAPLVVPLMTSQTLPTLDRNNDSISVDQLVTSCKFKDTTYFCPNGYRCSLPDSSNDSKKPRCVVANLLADEESMERCQTILAEEPAVYHHQGSHDFSRSKKLSGVVSLSGSKHSVFLMIYFFLFAAVSFAAVVVLLRDIRQYTNDDPEQALQGRTLSFVRGARKQIARQKRRFVSRRALKVELIAMVLLISIIILIAYVMFSFPGLEYIPLLSHLIYDDCVLPSDLSQALELQKAGNLPSEYTVVYELHHLKILFSLSFVSALLGIVYLLFVFFSTSYKRHVWYFALAKLETPSSSQSSNTSSATASSSLSSSSTKDEELDEEA